MHHGYRSARMEQLLEIVHARYYKILWMNSFGWRFGVMVTRNCSRSMKLLALYVGPGWQWIRASKPSRLYNPVQFSLTISPWVGRTRRNEYWRWLRPSLAKTRSLADADKSARRVYQSRSPNTVPFDMLGMVSY